MSDTVITNNLLLVFIIISSAELFINFLNILNTIFIVQVYLTFIVFTQMMITFFFFVNRYLSMDLINQDQQHFIGLQVVATWVDKFVSLLVYLFNLYIALNNFLIWLEHQEKIIEFRLDTQKLPKAFAKVNGEVLCFFSLFFSILCRIII